jgi:hypothetical protein
MVVEQSGQVVIMRKLISLLVPLLSLALSSPAQQAQSAITPSRGKAALVETGACKTLNSIGALVDGAFDGQKNETRILAPMLKDPDDSIWDTLIDCSQATTKASDRAKVLRVIAMWEFLRAEAFQNMYLEEVALLRAAKSAAPPLPAVQPSTQQTNPLVRSLQETQINISLLSVALYE